MLLLPLLLLVFVHVHFISCIFCCRQIIDHSISQLVLYVNIHIFLLKDLQCTLHKPFSALRCISFHYIPGYCSVLQCSVEDVQNPGITYHFVGWIASVSSLHCSAVPKIWRIKLRDLALYIAVHCRLCSAVLKPWHITGLTSKPKVHGD